RVLPTTESISSQNYPISRSLFFYIKNSHIKDVPAMKEYIDMFLSEELIGEDGLLTEIGLIPMAPELIEKNLEISVNKIQLRSEDLEE
ncbi:MAG TPA: phosphate-binding protein, partial [Gammaproteobacteria bacterium]|nr:phosphate-binding protein [Gammaproteobacteria bacterium]